MNQVLVRGFALILAAALLAPGIASAQDEASITGTVTDATGLILPGVTVEARDDAGNTQVTFSDGTGQYSFSGLAPGSYEVTFILAGFSAPAQTVQVSDGATATASVEMEVGLEERVVVVGTRAEPRSVTSSPVPVDVIRTGEFATQGTTDLANQLRTVVPSFNINIQPISDAATIVRPANLRNLAPDHNADPGQRQAPAPRGSHCLARERYRGWFTGARHLRDSHDRHSAGRGSARRRGGAVRL